MWLNLRIFCLNYHRIVGTSKLISIRIYIKILTYYNNNNKTYKH